ncbi:uncharacterized protein F5147DRAFT_654785 [Suillus discolor]|uniref:Uncharacterized protein n=1 Tax=Suillus discolor TaxID=1912936 RepID=A0A9P7JRY9_9AGAM|nr:uncharacterized protein F5147DRAFT_654785 [Suillus discolor]KAG2103482.1 hypothetical protein F5147DRAFT_654785 [Suillus discolor]
MARKDRIMQDLLDGLDNFTALKYGTYKLVVNFQLQPFYRPLITFPWPSQACHRACQICSSSAMSDTAQKSRTCPQNANKHPGLPDLPAKGRQRRTEAQIAEDNQILKESREVQEQAALEGLQWLAAMQKEMEKAEELTIVNKPKPVKPRARPVVKRTAPDKKLLTTGNADLHQTGSVHG